MGDKTFPLYFIKGDENYLSTTGITLKLGRNFSKDGVGDLSSVLLNEAALKRLGWKMDESVLGKILKYDNEGEKFEVIGVVSDFHFRSLASAVEPMAIGHVKNPAYQHRKSFALLKIEKQNFESWKSVINALQMRWKKHAGDLPFEYTFIDQAFAATFRNEEQFGDVLTILTSLALLIACLGLFGMIIYSLEQRTKEIGIRKVSGASIFNILVLIWKSYFRLILISFVISVPIAYWMIQLWLADFANRIQPSSWIFAGAGLFTLSLSFLVTGYHSIKASLTNPVEVLRDE